MLKLKDLLIPKAIDKKIRLGSRVDGGYVVSYDHIHTDYLISCGCDNRTSFEEDFLKLNPNSTVYIYDLNNVCDLANFKTNVIFTQKSIHSFNQLNCDKKSTIQIDIEGSEYEMLLNYNGSFNNIVQMIIEFHLASSGSLTGWSNIFNKINQYFELIHIHGNNCGDLGRFSPVPDVIECTYVNKDYLHKELPVETRSYPVPNLDYRNCLYQQELILDWWIN